jgi:DNA-binding transcriptional LysR family regulator
MNKSGLVERTVRYRRTMFQARDLPLFAVFVAVARGGSFTAAGRELGLSKSVVSAHVRTLEKRCGVRLFERSTRRLRLTQIGERLLGVAAKVLEATREVDDILEEQRDAPVGTLRIATTHDLSALFVAPIVARLAAHDRPLRVEIVSDDAPQDLIGGGFDLAVRLGAPQDSELVMRKLRVFAELIVAAPALARKAPARPRDLAGAPWVRHTLVSSRELFTFTGPHGEKDEITVSTRAQANTGEGVRALVLGGVGFGALPEYLIAADLKRGALVRVCPGWTWRDVTLYAVLPSAKRVPKRVQLFLGALKDAMPERT